MSINYYVDFDGTVFNSHKFTITLVNSLWDVLNWNPVKDLEWVQSNPKILAKGIKDKLKEYRNDHEDFWKQPTQKDLQINNRINWQWKISVDLDTWWQINHIANYLEETYGLDKEISLWIVEEIIKDQVIQDGNGEHKLKYIFDDVIPFLERIKKNWNKVYLLTSSTNPVFQIDKIKSSWIAWSWLKWSGNIREPSPWYFDQIIIATWWKSNIKNIDYENWIFIDDKIDVINDLVKNWVNPNNIILIRRETFDTSKQVDIPEWIKVISSLKELMNDFE